MDSSKTNQQEQKDKSTQKNPLQQATESVQAFFSAQAANPGPAIPKEFNVQEEGTKEERRKRAQELNRDK
ncbi:uncharacterized protein CTHT_0012570 [Thermochaetoides thermophila DSM 1495]|uniref:Uncharacterized protein n=1 Tax=Chaetomium thermophilum (strain DSM 1495 / CBS 144.50 / IMI 039719) TaxID=759272 RepID=G0S172_CHATD|nr:hypothetical protein CTHT_0012570 [Thermochaetoides thermophila DSM 1495]EGS22782.1 hypothetical protein CTHT_0012570 [Thermochaetoides thermophila DSM 1495]